MYLPKQGNRLGSHSISKTMSKLQSTSIISPFCHTQQIGCLLGIAVTAGGELSKIIREPLAVECLRLRPLDTKVNSSSVNETD